MLHELNASDPMSVTDDGTLIVVKLVHNLQNPIGSVLTFVETCRVVKLEHWYKACVPIIVTVSGIIRETTFVN